MSRRAEIISQAIALQRDSIVLAMIDANEQAAVIEAAAAEGVVVVDWPCSSRPTSISTAGRKDQDSSYPEAYKNLWGCSSPKRRGSEGCAPLEGDHMENPDDAPSAERY